MRIGQGTKHHIDIMFLMVLFLIFTFSAISLLLMAVNSYRTVVNASEENASARTAAAYIKEVCHQHDEGGAIAVQSLEGQKAIVIDEGEGYKLYIYAYDGALMELNAKDDSGAGAADGDVIMELTSMEISQYEDFDAIRVDITDTYGNEQEVDICLTSKEGTNGD